MDDETTSPGDTQRGMDRRSLLKRGAAVGGALVWTTPVVQSIASPALAAVGSGAPAELCPPKAMHHFQWRWRGTSPGLQSRVGGTCSFKSAAPVTTSTQLVRVGFEQAPAAGSTPAGYEASRARITLAPGYSLVRVQPRSADQSNVAGNCTPVIMNPTAVSGTCSTERVYVVDSTTLAKGRRTNLAWVTGEIRCDGC